MCVEERWRVCVTVTVAHGLCYALITQTHARALARPGSDAI